MQFPSTCLIDFYLFQFLTNSDNGDGRVEEKKNKKFLFCFEVVVLCGLNFFSYFAFFCWDYGKRREFVMEIGFICLLYYRKDLSKKGFVLFILLKNNY